MAAVARWKFDNSRSQSAFFEFNFKVGHGLAVPALREQNGRNERPTVGVCSPEQGSSSWSEGGQHIQREVNRETEGVQVHVTFHHLRRDRRFPNSPRPKHERVLKCKAVICLVVSGLQTPSIPTNGSRPPFGPTNLELKFALHAVQ